MYYAEKIINGIIHYKLTLTMEWKERSKESLTNEIERLRKEISELKDKE